MERLIELGRLLDCYGALLTERQQTIMRQYCDENLSLAEIAELEGISRQGVRDALTRGEQQLRALEQVVGMVQKREAQRRLLHRISERFKSAPLSVEDRFALEEGLRMLDGIWEDEDGV